MNIEKLEIKVNGENYICLKPSPIMLIQIEAECIDDSGNIDYSKWIDKMLRLVSKDIKKEDLIVFKGGNLELDNKMNLTVSEIEYGQYMYDAKMLKDGIRDVYGVVKLFMGYCGVESFDANSLSGDDVWAIIDAYTSIFDTTELDEVVDKLDSFR